MRLSAGSSEQGCRKVALQHLKCVSRLSFCAYACLGTYSDLFHSFLQAVPASSSGRTRFHTSSKRP
jgi:hypothetical protein